MKKSTINTTIIQKSKNNKKSQNQTYVSYKLLSKSRANTVLNSLLTSLSCGSVPATSQQKLTTEAQISEYKEILNPSDLKFRPIVADQSCLTNRLSKLVDILLQPFLYKIKKTWKNIRDDIHFLISMP